MEGFSQLTTVVLTFVFVVSTVIHAVPLPKEFQKCKKDDPNVNSCLRESIEKSLRIMKDGIASLQVLPADPLSITKLIIEDSPNRPVSIKLHIDDAKVAGFKDIQVKSVNADLNKRHAVVEAFLPLVLIDGDYDMEGKFLVLPLNGKGKIHAKLHNAPVKVTLQAEPLTKNGNVHWDVKTFDVSILKPTKFEVDFTNLFNGDQNLAKATLQTLNDNGLEFFEELRPAVEVAFSSVLSNIANTIFHKVSEKEMFL